MHTERDAHVLTLVQQAMRDGADDIAPTGADIEALTVGDPTMVVPPPRFDPTQVPGREELLPTYRYHAVFTDSPFTSVQAESQNRGHAITGQVNTDVIARPLVHLPPGRFSANDAWLTCDLNAAPTPFDGLLSHLVPEPPRF